MKDQKNRMVNSGDFRQDPNYVAPDKEKEKLILQLGTMITDRYLVKYSRTMKTDDPEYWALDDVLTKEEAKFLLSFKKTRVPYDIEDLAKMNNMSYEDTKKMVDHLVWVGLIEMTRENPDHHKQYNVPIFVPGSAEFMMMNDELTAQHPKLATFFNLMTQMPLENVTPMIPPGGAGVGMHVIPVEKAIESENMSASVEHISHWLSKYDTGSANMTNTLSDSVPAASSRLCAERAPARSTANSAWAWAIWPSTVWTEAWAATSPMKRHWRSWRERNAMALCIRSRTSTAVTK